MRRPAHPELTAEGGESQRQDGKLEDGRDHGDRPAERLDQGIREDTPGVDGPKRDLHHNACRGDEPMIWSPPFHSASLHGEDETM